MTHSEFVEWFAYLRMEADGAKNPGGSRGGQSWQQQNAAMMTHYNLMKGMGKPNARSKIGRHR